MRADIEFAGQGVGAAAGARATGLRVRPRLEEGRIVVAEGARIVFLPARKDTNVVGHTASLVLEADETQERGRRQGLSADGGDDQRYDRLLRDTVGTSVACVRRFRSGVSDRHRR